MYDYENDYYFEGESSIKLKANRTDDDAVVYAQETTKDKGPFYCADTGEEVIIRKCREKRDHFAYKSRTSPVGSIGSSLHIACKNELCDALSKRHPNGNWQTERNFPAKPMRGLTQQRPDVSGRLGSDRNAPALIIEVQASCLSIAEIEHRNEQYNKRNAMVLWVVPLKKDLGNNEFRPREFEWYLHTLFFRRVYYSYEGNGAILHPVHFSTAWRYINYTEYYDQSGTLQSHGGYYKPLRKTKIPSFGQHVNLLDDFHETRTTIQELSEGFDVPETRIYRDNQTKWWDENNPNHDLRENSL